jgi:Tol biopolymer transport system component
LIKISTATWRRRLIAAGGVIMIPAVVAAIVPVSHPTPVLTAVAINLGAGDQNDPHISGDWVAYADNFSIHYYNFTSGVDTLLPMDDSARDLLSDVSGSRIVFSRVIPTVKTAVMVFDAVAGGAPIELDPAMGTTRLGSAIGGDTVAYIDFGLQANGELVIHDLATSTSVRVTNDINPDQSPQVSPSGDVVVWEHCQSSMSNCDVWQAVRTGGAWNVTATTNSLNPEANPDTNGEVVVYDSNGEIFWRPAAGGAEVRLELPSFDANPSIAGNFIAFESRAVVFGTSDIFVYDLAQNRLYQLTNTVAVNEQLNDITVLTDGRVRTVWASDEDGFDQRNVRGATFTLARPAASQITDLIALVLSFNLKQGIENSFDAKLHNVLAALDAAGTGDNATACHKLAAFVHEVEAQTGKALTATQSAQLMAATARVKTELGCP